jgi:hypothetical protein
LWGLAVLKAPQVSLINTAELVVAHHLMEQQLLLLVV